MTRAIHYVAAVLCVCAIVAPLAPAAAPRYQITDLGALSTPGFSQAWAINAYGQVTGESSTTDAVHAFVWKPTTPNGTTGAMFSAGDLPGGQASAQAFGINASGEITGVGQTAADFSGQRAFLWKPSTPNGTSGAMTNLGTLPGNISSRGQAINAYGQVAGYSTTTVPGGAFLWTPAVPNGTTGSMQSLGVVDPNNPISDARGINDLGQVVGYTGASAGDHAFVWNPTTPNGTTGSMTDIGDLMGGGRRSVAQAINASGQVVGQSHIATFRWHAFRWTPNTPNGNSGSMADLGVLAGDEESFAYAVNNLGHVVGRSVSEIGGETAVIWTPQEGLKSLPELLGDNGQRWYLPVAYGINDFGQIVGAGFYDADGPGGEADLLHGYLLTPIPEPAAGALLIAALLTSRREHRRADRLIPSALAGEGQGEG